MRPLRRMVPFAAMCALALLATTARGADAPLSADLLAAQSAYDQGVEKSKSDPEAAQKLFLQSADGFEKIAQSGIANGPLLYNLGNAQVQAKQVGRGIGSYLRAQRIMPGDTQLQSNLAHARSLVKDRFDSGGGILMEDVSAWWHLLSFNGRLALAGLLWTGAWIGAALLFLRPTSLHHESARAVLRRVCWSCGIVGAVLGATVVADVAAARLWPQGVTITDGVMVRKGNGEGFEPQFAEPLSQGVEFRVLEQRPGWLLIRLGDGKTGWIPAAQSTTA
ncbi:MAG: SH3 domain-containing protein [Planctomycetes bacterium]|nr:SH3 domain-containing protein [Planctomycetota bacterium]